MGATILTRPDQTRPDQTRPDQTRPDQTANYDLLYDKDFYGEALYINHFIDKKLTFRTIQDGYILPYCCKTNQNGIFDSAGIYVQDSSYMEGGLNSTLNENPVPLNKIAQTRSFSVSDAEHKHSTVVFVGAIIKVWGHFITDSMRLLWFLMSKEYQENFSDCPIVYFPVQGFELKGNWLRMFEILGINTSLMAPVTELTRYDKIILPDECFFMTSKGARYFTSEYVEAINCVRNFAARNFAAAQSSTVKSKKIYYSYSDYSTGNHKMGEDKLERYFASKGYDIIYPERLSLEEQLTLLINCESFASTIGSCSHNMLFCHDNTEILLIPRAIYLNGYQAAIDQVHPQNIHYIDSSFSIFVSKRPWGGPFLYFISSNLRKYFHDEDTESIIYPSDFWKYLRSVLGFKTSHRFGLIDFGVIDDADHPETYRYYSTVAAEYFGKLVKTSWPYRLRQWLKKLFSRKKPTP